MSITMLPSTCVFLLAYIGYGVLLQPVECMPSMYPSPTDLDDSGNLKSTQLATVQSREDPLKILFRMFLDAERLAKKQMNNRLAVTQQTGFGCSGISPGTMCGVFIPCGCQQPPLLDTDAIERILKESKPKSSKQVMIARSKKRGRKRPMMRGKKKRTMHNPKRRKSNNSLN